MRVGIDLGTTFSVIARIDPTGVPILFPDFRDAEQFKTPSVVHLTPEGGLVGRPVEDLLTDSPELSVARFAKLQMGREEPVLRDHLGRAWTADVISALILKKLLRDARSHADEPIDAAVIGVPAHFNDLQRQATLDAAHLAGIGDAQLIEEPLAAAIHYGAHGIQSSGLLLVFDLGGGTFDCTLLQVEREGLRPLATDGAANLGGKNFDEILMRQIADTFQAAHGLDPHSDPVAAMQLRREAEAIKIRLSQPKVSQARKSLLLCGRVQEVVITRSRLESACAPLLARTMDVCNRTLAAAGVGWNDLDRVMLVGGSTLLPGVETALRMMLGSRPERLMQNKPHMAVAYGAAQLAHQQAIGTAEPGKRILQRICGFDLGFRVFDQVRQVSHLDVLVPRNSPVPISKSVIYYTHRADQARLVLDVAQRKGPNDVPTSLGHFQFAVERPRLHHPVRVTLGYDDTGAVSVVARNPETGTEMRREFSERDAGDSSRLSSRMELLNAMPLCT